MTQDRELPQFIGPLVQWPRYGATYRGENFTISPVPTDDGRWMISINEWTDNQNFHPTVVAAIDAALAAIKQTVDHQASQGAAAPTPMPAAQPMPAAPTEPATVSGAAPVPPKSQTRKTSRKKPAAES
jgi:hypothetical protein